MALDPTVLANGLRSFMDSSFGGFAGYPVDEADAAAKWAAAVDAFTGTGGLISPPSIAGLGAKDALQTGLAGMSAPGVGPAIFDSAFVLYATALAAGMAPSFVGTPPPPGTLAPAMAAQAALGIVPGGVPPAVQLEALAGIIALWFKTGTATPSGGGPPVFWI